MLVTKTQSYILYLLIAKLGNSHASNFKVIKLRYTNDASLFRNVRPPIQRLPENTIHRVTDMSDEWMIPESETVNHDDTYLFKEHILMQIARNSLLIRNLRTSFGPVHYNNTSSERSESIYDENSDILQDVP